MRKANDIVDESFEQVADKAAKLKLNQVINNAQKEQVKNEQNDLFQLFERRRELTKSISDRTKQILSGFDEISPTKQLEKALYYKQERENLARQEENLINQIYKAKQSIRNAQSYTRSPRKPENLEASIEYAKEKVGMLNKALESTRQQLRDSTDQHIGYLKHQRKDKIMMTIQEMNDKLAKDVELNNLQREAREIDFKLANTQTKALVPVYKSDAKDAIYDQQNLIEQRVKQISGENGEDL